MKSVRLLGWGLGAALALQGTARAEWYEARTNHFIVNIDADEATARTYAERLELFDAALRKLYAAPDDPASHSNPVRIFVLKAGMFSRVCQWCSGVLGFYRARAGGSAIYSIFDPRFDRRAKEGDMTSTVVLLHEYAHHFMYSTEPIAYPMWFSEGFAEFNGNAEFEADGSVVIGLPANYRARVMQSDVDYLQVSLTEFFTTPNSMNSAAVIYSRGWLMTHYLMLSPGRQGQLAKYLHFMNQGKPSLEAGAAAFGDLKALWGEMFDYYRGKKLLPPVRIPPPAKPVSVSIRKLSSGVAQMMPTRARFENGATGALARELARGAAKIASAYPDDARVQLEYAETELAAEQFDAAERAADAALQLAPDMLSALVAKGQARVRRLAAAKSTDVTAWTEARSWLLKANRVDPNAAVPLTAYYRSFLLAGATPTDGAVKGLRRAHVLGPEDRSVRVMLARYLLEQDDRAGARQLLQPIAFAPHRKREKNHAGDVIELIDAGKPAEARAAMAKLTDAEEED